MDSTSEKQVEAELKSLNRHRGIIKGKLTLFSKYVSSLSPPIDSDQYIDLELRFNKIDSILTEFEKIQDKIEILCADYDAQLAEREKFEKAYYTSLTAAKKYLNEFREQLKKSQPKNSDGSSNPPMCESVKLPDIALPTFNGDVTKWLEFRDTFDALIHQTNMKPIQKLKYLRSCLTDGALDVIASLDYCEESYQIAWRLLCDRYNNNKMLVNNHLRALFNIDSVQSTPSALRSLVDSISRHLRTLNNLELSTENWDVLVIFFLSSKLDKFLQRKWEEKTNSRELPTLQDFKYFLRSQADLLESLGADKSSEQSNTSRRAMVVTSSPVHGNAVKPNQRSKVFSNHCPLCKETHYINQCTKFLALNVTSRIRTVKRLGLCSNCLGSSHAYPNCRASHCRTCKGKHHTLLHIPTNPNHNSNQQNTEQQIPTPLPTQSTLFSSPTVNETPNPMVSLHTYNPTTNNTKPNHNQTPTNNKQHNTAILPTALVNITDANNQTHTLRALLDSGSQSNFITESAFEKLKLPKKHINMQVLGFCENVTQIKYTCNLNIQSRTEAFSTYLPFFIVPLICKLTSYTTNIKHFHIPDQLKLADESFFMGGEVDMILGSEIFYSLLCNGQHQLGVGLPMLQNTRLGWVVAGSLQIPTLTRTVRCNFVKTNMVTKLTPEFWGNDSPTRQLKAPDDDNIQCERVFQTHTRNSDGSFVVNLPLKEPVTSLGQSRHIAYKRFKTLESKFSCNPEFKENYVNFMREFESSGHMITQDKNEPCNYLPHHAVINLQKTTTPLRVVIDASSKTSSGKSLNDLQYKGSVIQDELVNILLRFRKHKFVLCADIEKMYRMIHINPNQYNLQAIFWRENPNQPLRTYNLTTLSFGLKCAPYIATRCLLQLSQENRLQWPDAAAVIASDFYMDDLLYGGDNEQKVAETAVQVSRILSSANFNLRKWKSNSTALLYHVSNETNTTLNLSPTTITQHTHKILGLQWNSHSDYLSYTFKQETMPDVLTKRNILSMASAIFDPLGLLAPVLLNAKLLIQQLWKNKSSWDERIPTDLCKQWECFQTSLPVLNSLIIPRHVFTVDYVITELHGFADSSLTAYGSAVYLRSIDTYGNIIVRLLCAKSRVARNESIPRLELRAAHLLANLVYKLQEVLKHEFTNIHLWSDSNVALAWIKADSNKLKPFIKNRVIDIKKLTNIDNWHWVPSRDNPADILSRGISAEKFLQAELWWQGPSWLSKPNKEWPSQVVHEPTNNDKDIICSLSTEMSKNQFITQLCHRWSKCEKLIRVFAYVLRFINNVKNKNKTIKSPLTVDELNQSLNKLIMFVQMDTFPCEYQLLKKNQPIRQTSNILCLNPYMENGLIRVGGRLKNSPYTHDKKHPILLHNKHILTKLIVQSYHTKLLHAGPQLLLSSIRERFWPINGKSLATKTARECVTCFRAKPRTSTPMMGNLPASRVTPSPPFLTTGVDYAGPFTLRNWRGRGYKTSKCYIALFVCFSTKAIHIELVTGLDTQTFLAAFRRFVSRRGKPSQMVSDNGTTFHGANNELLELYKFITDNYNDIMTSCANEGIKWSFLPAYTPHMGGLHEAAVKGCKYFLKRILGQALLTYEEFATVLIQVEGILNSRPLCPISNSDVNDFSVLTPAHFLIGRAITNLPDYDYKNVPTNRLTHFQQLQQLQQDFWRRWSRDYIGTLQCRTKWRSCKGPGLGVGTMVLVKDERLPPCQWRLGRIIQTHDGQDGLTRVATIQTARGPIRRAFNTICPLPLNVS